MSRNWRAEQCIAITDYTAANSSEISFRRGDVISVVGKRGDNSGYWEGITTGINLDVLTGKKNKELCNKNVVASRGLFLTCCVTSNMRACMEPCFTDKVLSLHDYTPRRPEEMTLQRGDVVTVTRPGTAAGWWYGVKEGSDWRVPQRCVQKLDHPVAPTGKEQLFPINFVTAKIVVASTAGQGNAVNELPFGQYDVIKFLRKWNDGWWEGFLRGIRGIFPSNLTHPNTSTTTPPLFCNKCKSIYASVGAACAECTANEDLSSKMIANLNRYLQKRKDGGVEGGGGDLDLFEGIEHEVEGKLLQAFVGGRGEESLEATTVRKFGSGPPK